MPRVWDLQFSVQKRPQEATERPVANFSAWLALDVWLQPVKERCPGALALRNRECVPLSGGEV